MNRMNAAQKRILKSWLIIALFFFGLTVAWLSPIENKQLAGVIVAVPFFIWASLNKDLQSLTGYGPDSVTMVEFIESNGILKIWLVFYCALILPFLIFKILVADKTPYGLFVLAFGLLVLPMFIISEFQRFVRAGNKS
jgi:hypothetical protein